MNLRHKEVTITEGESRAKSGFLFLPKKINGEWRWLEFAAWREVYYISDAGESEGIGFWMPKKWLGIPGGDRTDVAGKTYEEWHLEATRFFVSGPEGSFWTSSSEFAEHLLEKAQVDRDDWTVTDTKNPRGYDDV